MLKKFLTLPRRISRRIKFVRDFSNFKKEEKRFSVLWQDTLPCLGDNTGETLFDAHYVYHPAWAARVLAQTRPEKHIDIGSILNFNAIVSAFVPVEFYDYRPANVQLDNLTSKHADITSLPFPDASVASISSMHTIEHVGLGRYGDTVDHEGDKKAIAEMKRVTKQGGDILFVVPVGKPRIMYNAHRIYSYEQVHSYFEDSCELKDFFLIPDDAIKNGPVENATAKDVLRQKYACGCFWFKKKV